MKNWLVVSNIFYFHPYLGKWSILTNIFQRGWNHQLEKVAKKAGGNFFPKNQLLVVRWGGVATASGCTMAVEERVLTDFFRSKNIFDKKRVFFVFFGGEFWVKGWWILIVGDIFFGVVDFFCEPGRFFVIFRCIWNNIHWNWPLEVFSDECFEVFSDHVEIFFPSALSSTKGTTGPLSRLKLRFLPSWKQADFLWFFSLPLRHYSLSSAYSNKEIVRDRHECEDCLCGLLHRPQACGQCVTFVEWVYLQQPSCFVSEVSKSQTCHRKERVTLTHPPYPPLSFGGTFLSQLRFKQPQLTTTCFFVIFCQGHSYGGKDQGRRRGTPRGATDVAKRRWKSQEFGRRMWIPAGVQGTAGKKKSTILPLNCTAAEERCYTIGQHRIVSEERILWHRLWHENSFFF